MTYELILTSVSQGLEPDSHGFCVVARNQDISAPLIERLSSLSSMRHRAPVHDPRTESEEQTGTLKSQTVFSHLIVTVEGHSWHVLTQISDVGTDYRHLPNHLAHHLAFQNDETTEQGPAWILASAGSFLTQWLTPSVLFKTGRRLPQLFIPQTPCNLERIQQERYHLDPIKMSFLGVNLRDLPSQMTNKRFDHDQESIPCPLWKRLTGDAGWSGVLMATAYTGQQAVILHQPGFNVLPLFVESMALLPTEMRWRTTFTTCYTGLPEHVSCQWKAVTIDSPEAAELKLIPDILVIDLTKTLGEAPSGPYLPFARTGKQEALPAGTAMPLFRDANDSSHLFDPVDAEATPPPLRKPEPDGMTVTESIPPVLPEQAIQIHPVSTQRSGLLHSLLSMRSRSAFYAFYAVTLLLVLFLVGLVLEQLGVTHFMPQTSTPTPQAGRNTPPQPPDPTTANPSTANELTGREAIVKKWEKIVKSAQLLFNDKFDKDFFAIGRIFDELTLPASLSLKIPELPLPLDAQIGGQVFEELAPLYSCGSALELEIIPLLALPDFTFETRFEPVYIKPTDYLSEEEMDVIGVDLPQTDEYLARDPGVYQWSVWGVGQNSSAEVCFLRLKLTKEGLFAKWEPNAWAPQNQHDAMRLTLAFLRLKKLNEENVSKIKSVSLFFAPIIVPIIPSQHFSDENSTVVVETPFTAEPWASFFGSEDYDPASFPARFRWDVRELPAKIDGIKKVVFPQTDDPAKFKIVFYTDVEYKKTATAGAIEYEPVPIECEAVFNPTEILWQDRYHEQIKAVESDLEKLRAEKETVEREKGDLDRALFNKGLDAEERKRHETLKTAVTTLENKERSLADFLGMLPDAHERFLACKDLRFHYSIVVEPADTRPQIPQERSIILMKTGEEQP